MADIALVIKISEELYDLIQNKLDFNGDLKQKDIKTLMLAIDDGIPLNKIRTDIVNGLSNAEKDSRHTQDDIDCGICVRLQKALDTIDKYRKEDK